ncbi:alpha/beta fold hydrolase [Nocardia aurantiaca]|uniref:alpha/beta fold hydrolase n=1 Tax=Nocardia aurantiaca TaxID=2675850 RepID=UPI0018AC25F1|nr:alpha/beta hydrolase [Nocardia aurantiaca]
MTDGPAQTLPAVLLHGWTWNADINFADVIEPLSCHHRVIAPDARMHGRGIRTSGPWRLRDASDDVIALLDAFGIEQALFCGFSMGGMMVADLLTRYPDRVAGYVMQSAAAHYRQSPRERAVWVALRGLQPLAERGLNITAGRYFNASLPGNAALAERWDWLQAELGRQSLLEIITVAADIGALDLRPTLRRPTCPGEYHLLTMDRVCRPSMQADLARRLGASIVSVDADHDLPVTDAARYIDLTVSAIRRVAAQATDRTRAS